MQTNDCYKFCNDTYPVTDPSMRLFCKKGCDADDADTLQACKTEFCNSLCIKEELGEDDDKKPKWTAIFARAPMDSTLCLSACMNGCMAREEDDD